MADGDLTEGRRRWAEMAERARKHQMAQDILSTSWINQPPPGFITGDWSVEYSPIVYGTAEESRNSQRALLKAACAETNIFPAAAMRDSAF